MSDRGQEQGASCGPGCEPSASAGQEAVFAESHPSREGAKTDFDPDCCPWCGDTNFDLRGLAQHVWQRCDVVERLANENADDMRAWHQKNYEDHQRRKEAARDSDGSGEAGETGTGSTEGGSEGADS